MRTKGTATALEARRLVAADLLLDGKSVAEVAEIVGASESSVRRWRSAYRSGGAAALAAKPHSGPKPKLSLRRQHRLIEILTGGAQKAGYRTELWTGRRIAEVIQRHFGIAYHRGTVCRLLRSLHWSPQRPEHRARERDEKAIGQWRPREWPRIKRGATTSS